MKPLGILAVDSAREQHVVAPSVAAGDGDPSVVVYLDGSGAVGSLLVAEAVAAAAKTPDDSIEAEWVVAAVKHLAYAAAEECLVFVVSVVARSVAAAAV